MLLGTLGTNLLGNFLAGKGINRAGEELVKTGYVSWIKNKDCVFWYWNSLDCFVYSGIGTHWIAWYTLKNDVTYFDSFGVEHIPKQTKMFIGKSIVVANIFRIQANDSVICGYSWIGFIDFILKCKTLTD